MQGKLDIMRHKGSISQINIERNKVVLELFQRAKNLVKWPSNITTICETAAKLPVDKFYISTDAAVVYVRQRYYNNKIKIFNSPYKQQLYEVMYKNFLKVVESPENKNRSLPELVIKVLAMPAPCLGLAPFQFYMAVLRQQKKK